MQPLTVIRVFLFSNARRVGIIIGNILFRILKPVTQFKFNNSTKLFKYRVLKRDIYLRKIPILITWIFLLYILGISMFFWGIPRLRYPVDSIMIISALSFINFYYLDIKDKFFVNRNE